MPKESGLMTLKKIKRLNPRIQVIVITAYGSSFSMKACLKEGADDFLIKPFNIEELHKVVLHNIEKIIRWEEIDKTFALYPEE